MTTAISFEAGDIAAAAPGNAPAVPGAGASFAEALKRKQTESSPSDPVGSGAQTGKGQASPAKGGDTGVDLTKAEQKDTKPSAGRQIVKKEKTKDKAGAAGCTLNAKISTPLPPTVLPSAGPVFGEPPAQSAAKPAEEDKGCGPAGPLPAGALGEADMVTAMKAPQSKEKQNPSAVSVAPAVAQAQDASAVSAAQPLAQAQDASAAGVAQPVAQAQDASAGGVAQPVAQAQDASAVGVAPAVAQAQDVSALSAALSVATLQDLGLSGIELMKAAQPGPVAPETPAAVKPGSAKANISKQETTGATQGEVAPAGAKQAVDKGNPSDVHLEKERGKDDPIAAAVPVSGGPADAKAGASGGHITAEALHPANLAASSSAAHESVTADPLSRAATMSAGDEKVLNPQSGMAAQMQAQIRSTQTSHVSGMVDAARLVQRLNQSELNLNLQTSEFGRVDIRTTLSKHAFAASIYVEQDALLPVLAAELPSLHMHLSEHGVEANVTLNPSSFSQNSSAQAGAGQQDRRQTPPQRPSLENLREREIVRSGAALSRTKSLTSLLDVHA